MPAKSLETEMPATKPLQLFEGYGVELEYMIVDKETLNVLPVTDKVMQAATGSFSSDYENGDIAWSNELVNHVIELKTNGPARTLEGIEAPFQRNIHQINSYLDAMGAMLMPTGAHPWMNPFTDTQLWPHEYNAVYETYNKIFNCQGHGWSNLQSTHLNLPFGNDEEFGRLHAAIRIVLPLLPALAASTPIIELKASGSLDTRLEFYRKNSAKIPSLTADIVPEAVFSEADYRKHILERCYKDIAPHDPENTLQDEFLNSRGAIARFGRGSIEIRILDIQECPQADIAILKAICSVLQALTNEELAAYEAQKHWQTIPLKSILLDTIEKGEKAIIRDKEYLNFLGLSGESHTAQEIWQSLIKRYHPSLLASHAPLATILEHGTLATRILKGCPERNITKSRAEAVYRELCTCLADGKMFLIV